MWVASAGLIDVSLNINSILKLRSGRLRIQESTSYHSKFVSLRSLALNLCSTETSMRLGVFSQVIRAIPASDASFGLRLFLQVSNEAKPNEPSDIWLPAHRKSRLLGSTETLVVISGRVFASV